MEQKGLLLVLSGPSGCGKGTMVKELISREGQIEVSRSATSRAPREGEVDGLHYDFVSRERFEEMIKNGEVLEYTQYNGNYYGTQKAQVETMLASGKDVILEIETEGAMNIRRAFADAVLVFVVPPSFQVLRQRLIGRGTESMEVIEDRLAIAKKELSLAEQYDYLVVNGQLETAVWEVESIIVAEKRKVLRNIEMVRSLLS